MKRQTKAEVRYERQVKEWLYAQHNVEEALLTLDYMDQLIRDRDAAVRHANFVSDLGLRYKKTRDIYKAVLRACKAVGTPELVPRVVKEVRRIVWAKNID